MLELVQRFISELLDVAGNDIFRMKGVLHVAHAEQRYVYHAVHNVFDGAFDEPWTHTLAAGFRIVPAAMTFSRTGTNMSGKTLSRYHLKGLHPSRFRSATRSEMSPASTWRFPGSTS